MPALDRRIIVRHAEHGVNDFGEPTEEVTEFPVWATRLDASLIDAATAGGDVDTATRSYIVRWRREFAEAVASELSVIEGLQTHSVDNIIEQARERDERRRFLRIETVAEVTT